MNNVNLDTFLNNTVLKNNVNWVEPLLKTAYSKNITTDEWNALIHQVVDIISKNTDTYDGFVNVNACIVAIESLVNEIKGICEETQTTADNAKTTANNAKLAADSATARTVNFQASFGAYITDNSISIGDYMATEGLQFSELADGTYQVSAKPESNETKIIIPATHNGIAVTKISNKGFSGLRNLTEVIIGDNVEFIGNAAFSMCTNLKEITVGKSVDEIGVNAFDECVNLINVNYNAVNCHTIHDPDDSDIVYTPRSPFTVCGRDSGGFNVTVGEGVESIPAYLFKHYDNPPEDDEVDVDDGDAIAYLKSIVIPSSVKTIGEKAFLGCTELTDIYFKGTESAWNRVKKGGCEIPNGVTIHIKNPIEEDISFEIDSRYIRNGGVYKVKCHFNKQGYFKLCSLDKEGNNTPISIFEKDNLPSGTVDFEIEIPDEKCRYGVHVDTTAKTYALYTTVNKSIKALNTKVNVELGEYVETLTTLLGGN